MDTQIHLEQIHAKIQVMKEAAEDLNRLGRDFPAVARNTARIMASLKMLEINVSDLLHLGQSG